MSGTTRWETPSAQQVVWELPVSKMGIEGANGCER